MKTHFTRDGLILESEGGQDDYLLSSFWDDWQAGRVTLKCRLQDHNEEPMTIEPDKSISDKARELKEAAAKPAAGED